MINVTDMNKEFVKRDGFTYKNEPILGVNNPNNNNRIF